MDEYLVSALTRLSTPCTPLIRPGWIFRTVYRPGLPLLEHQEKNRDSDRFGNADAKLKRSRIRYPSGLDLFLLIDPVFVAALR